MARPELGIKRQCQNCGAKFYDLTHDPATCPKCGTVQQVVAAAVVARGRPEPARRAPEAEDKHREDDAMAGAVGLEEAEEGANAPAEEEEDVAVEGEEGGEEDVFLEEDEEDENGVSGLIDGDIEDEES